MMKCKDCSFKEFNEYNSGPNRYYCTHKAAGKAVNQGARMISRCDRGSKKLKIKTSPRWCPLKASQS